MSREYMVFDKSGCSERIILFHVRDFIISASEIDGLHPEGNGFKEAMALGVGVLENAKLLRLSTSLLSIGFQNISQICNFNKFSSLSMPLLEEEFSRDSSFSYNTVIASMANEIQSQQQNIFRICNENKFSSPSTPLLEEESSRNSLFSYNEVIASISISNEIQLQQENIFKIYNVNKFENLSLPLLEKESSKNSSFFSSEVIASMAYNEIQQELQVDEEGSNCCCGEAGDELDALLNLGDNLDDTADSMEVGEHSSQRIREPFEKLRNIVGGECMDPVDVLDEAIQYVKRLEMDLKKLKDL